MTREEAIKVLRTESVEIGGNAVSVARWLKALDVAIKALDDVPDKDVWKNEPLTLDELRSAYKFGCPVWLVGMEDGDGWVFIHHVDSCSVRYARIGTSEEWCFRTKSYGVRVWAYRQKPEEDDHDERKENENA